MIHSFRNVGTRDIFLTADTKEARRTLPVSLHRKALLLLSRIAESEDVSDMRIPPGNMLQELSGDRVGQYSVRINHQHRICFEWASGNAYLVEICDYH